MTRQERERVQAAVESLDLELSAVEARLTAALKELRARHKKLKQSVAALLLPEAPAQPTPTAAAGPAPRSGRPGRASIPEPVPGRGPFPLKEK